MVLWRYSKHGWLQKDLSRNSSHFISSLIQHLQREFPLKDLGSLSFLGIQVTQTPHGLHLNQSKYIVDLLSRVHIDGSKLAPSPCGTRVKMSHFDGDPLANPTFYRHVVGALQYCILPRPEIAFLVNQLCQHLHSPMSTNWSSVKLVLRYLIGTIGHGLFYAKSTLQLQAYCDSHWAGCLDDCQSTSGFAVYLGNSFVSSSAKKQPVVSCSSTKVEYRSLAITTAELYWLCMLFQEIGIPLPIARIIWCDNISALALASNSDIFTKGLSSARFAYLKSKLLVLPPINFKGAVKDTILQHEDSAISP
ncbi:uncharacterized mitochondrial protein AtMg00810-like [Alnus glutinosa]|uniref:uncharacterized mitochondrial protein AtMg00810-like n=1 Tax=Alnus glutinosa TaxID=3517 RepID=UPI002D77DF62|nr:uncharacterized mitochondrial protein AtMg00810-like [Alnus glutinosa]